MTDPKKVISWLRPALDTDDCLIELPYNVVKAIYELLKAQEPRVLTLEEVTAGDECWLEHKSGVCGYVDCYICTGNRSVEVWRTSKQGPDYLSWERYLKGWRCWSARPTDEQREAVKWQD